MTILICNSHLLSAIFAAQIYKTYMKQIFIIIYNLFFFSVTYAQIIANDSAQTGTGSSSMTFYSLKTGQKTIVSNTDWHLAISIRPTQFQVPFSPIGGTTIRMNEAMGVKVYYVPDANAAAFNIVDTTGYKNWTILHDSDTSIDEGVLNSNRNKGNIYDFGWGTYNGSNHNVTGDSLYLIQLPNGELKKFIVVNLDRDTAFNLKYSNIDNSDLQTIHISKKDYIGKEFVYLNLLDNEIHDKEPLAADWDLQFLKYTATDILSNKFVPVVGVWLNKGALAAQRMAHDVTDNDYSNLTFSHKLNAIGWNWKYQGSSQALLSGKNIFAVSEFYLTKDSLTYFVQTVGAQVYKVIFTRYNPGNGQIDFYKELLTPLAIDEPKNESVFQLFPNPTSSILNVVLNATGATFKVADLNGRIVLEEITTENTTQINTDVLSNGIYLLLVTTNGNSTVRRFVVSK